MKCSTATSSSPTGRARSSSARARVRQDRRRVAQIGFDRGHAGDLLLRQELPAEAHRHGVVVHVDNARGGIDAPRDLVDVAAGGQPRADVEELVDALPRQVGDGAAQEGPVGAGGERVVRVDRGERVEGGAVGREVGAAPKRVVVDARRVRPVEIGAARRQRARGSIHFRVRVHSLLLISRPLPTSITRPGHRCLT